MMNVTKKLRKKAKSQSLQTVIFSLQDFFFHPSYMVVEKGWLWLQDAVMPVVYGTLVTMLKNGIFEKM